MNNNLDNPFYYLENFRFVLSWVSQRYRDLLDLNETNFIQQFSTLPIPSQALLVRMVMRRGNLFRESKLQYGEIGDTAKAAEPLLTTHWIAIDPLITVEQLYNVLTKQEFAQATNQAGATSLKKTALLEMARHDFAKPRLFSTWCSQLDDVLYEVCVASLCDRLRLMFFGNLRQDWSEFVLADLGIFSFEKVPFSDESRAFKARDDIDFYLHLHTCRENFLVRDLFDDAAHMVEAASSTNPWLQYRRAKLLFQIGQEYERRGDYASAQRVYHRSHYPGTRLRLIRVLEKLGSVNEAYIVAQQATIDPENAEESQQLLRVLPRLQRKLGLVPDKKSAIAIERIDLLVARPADGIRVEEVAAAVIENQAQSGEIAPVFYVENTLINSLFGLLCWEAIFSPVPGAFFHPFQAGPADLHTPHFREVRKAQFQRTLDQLENDEYVHTIRENFRKKSGLQSPFVFWGILNDELLELALKIFPAKHLKYFFERILDSIAANRCGFPDLIQFWPQQRRYRMIEVKGPGDRLQDNQLRFIEFCQQHEIPVVVCYVEWER